jgi:hypothetical protein
MQLDYTATKKRQIADAKEAKALKKTLGSQEYHALMQAAQALRIEADEMEGVTENA